MEKLSQLLLGYPADAWDMAVLGDKSQGAFDSEQRRRFLSGAGADDCMQGAT